MSRVSVEIPEDCFQAELPASAFTFSDTQGVVLKEPPSGPVSVAFEGDVSRAAFDAAGTLIFAPTDDGVAGGSGSVTVTAGNGRCIIDVALGLPTLQDINVDASQLLIRMTAPVAAPAPDPVPAPDPAPAVDPAAGADTTQGGAA